MAIHPFLTSLAEITDVEYFSNESKLTFKYTIAKNNDGVHDYTTMKDILVATHRRIYNMDEAGPLKLNLRHVLAQVVIAPALNEVLMYENEDERDKYPYNKDEYIQFTRFEIYGLKTRATFSFTPEPIPAGQNKTDNLVGTYNVDDNSIEDAVLTFSTPPIVTNNNENVPICHNNDAMLVLPQKIDESARLVLYYTVNGDNTEFAPIRKLTFSLSDLPIKEWEADKIYTYKFTIEKAYYGQIKPGTIKWEVNDASDSNAKDRWIYDDEDQPIRQEFTIK